MNIGLVIITSPSGVKGYLNANHIMYIEPDCDEYQTRTTKIVMVNGYEYYAIETPEEIFTKTE